MSKIKKVLAVLLTLAMVLGMSVSAFAGMYNVDTKIPDPGDTATITVSGVNDKNATVTAYRVVQSYFEDNVFKGYKPVEGFESYFILDKNGYIFGTTNSPSIAKDGEDPGTVRTVEFGADVVTNLAKKIDSTPDIKDKVNWKELEITNENTGADGTYTCDYIGEDMLAGTWLIIVTNGDPEKVYNPMIASVYYVNKDGQDIVGGEAPADGDFMLQNKAVYAKSNKEELTKVITDGNQSQLNDKSGTTDKGTDVAYGGNVPYEVNTTIPSYSEEYFELEGVTEYQNAQFVLTDTLSEGLIHNKDVTVTIGPDESGTVLTERPKNSGKLYAMVDGNEILAATIKYEGEEKGNIPTKDDPNVFESTSGPNQMIITFEKDYLRALANKSVADRAVKVTYSVLVTDGVGVNAVPNSNTVELDYTHRPGEKPENITKKTYTYTFGIDVSLDGTNDFIGSEFFKTEEGSVEERRTTDGKVTSVTGPLPDAEFKLYKGDAGVYIEENKLVIPDGTMPIRIDSTGDDGRIEMKGLDVGTYYLVETKAPRGYSLNPTPMKVVIEATYNEDGTLAGWTVTINDTLTGSSNGGTTEYKVTNDGGLTVTPAEQWPYQLPNTKLTELPSTGGIGTTIFTVGGCLIMIIAAGLFFASRRKSSK